VSDDFDIKWSGMTELYSKLEEVRIKFPFKEEEILKKLGTTLKASAKAKTPVGKNKEHLKDSYTVSKAEFGDHLTSANLVTKSPHWHLVEAGHDIVQGGEKGKGGVVTGHVPGKFMVEISLQEMDATLPTVIETWLDKTLGDTK